MKTLLVIFAFISTAILASAQNDPKEVSFIRTVAMLPTGTIYTDYLDGNQVDRIKEYLTKHDTLLAGKLVLSAKDRLHINTTVELMGKPIWKAGVIENGVVINADDINTVFKDYIDIANGWRRFYEKYQGGVFYSFSKPIFLRNNRYSLFMIENRCGHRCYESEFCLYEKVKGKWTMVRKLSYAIS